MKQFNNNMVEINRNQSGLNVVIDDFFNTESNANIFKMITIIEELEKFILHSKSKSKTPFKSTSQFTDFLNNFEPEEFEKIIESFTTKNKTTNEFNIIRFLLYTQLYEKEKKDIFRTIETSESTDEEFIFIEIIVPYNVLIDINSIEDILSPYEIKMHMADKIYDLINVDEGKILDETKKNFIDYDRKIQLLFDNKIVIPIVDDFMLYHKNNEKYEESFKTAQNKNENTKIFENDP